MLHKFSFFLFAIISFSSCCEKAKNNAILKTTVNSVSSKKDTTQIITDLKENNEDDYIVLSEKHDKNSINGDVDGDGKADTVQIVINTKNNKSGLKITYGDNSKQPNYFGLGKDILNQGFDEIDWIGIFEIAPKNEVYYNNVNDEGEIITEDQVKESDKIKLTNDGIFIHAAESCGGGIIYLDNGKFKWIQQE